MSFCKNSPFINENNRPHRDLRSKHDTPLLLKGSNMLPCILCQQKRLVFTSLAARQMSGRSVLITNESQGPNLHEPCSFFLFESTVRDVPTNR